MSEIERLERRLGARLGDVLPPLGAAGLAALLGAALAGEPVRGD